MAPTVINCGFQYICIMQAAITAIKIIIIFLLTVQVNYYTIISIKINALLLIFLLTVFISMCARDSSLSNTHKSSLLMIQLM